MSVLVLITLCVPMGFPIKFNTVKPGWYIVYLGGPGYNLNKNIVQVSLSPKIG